MANASSPSKVKVQLGPVQETLLIPLLARAEENKKPDPYLRDPKAVEIIQCLDYDFSKWANPIALAAGASRTLLFDEHVARFLSKYPNGTVVDIGAGLNTRYERLDNGKATWFELDLPDSMELRRRFFQDEPRRKMIAGSVTETDWFEVVKRTGGPWCFTSEAVMVYLETEEAEKALKRIADEFEESWFVLDTVSQRVLDLLKSMSMAKSIDQRGWIKWSCDEPKQLESICGYKWVQSKGFADLPSQVADHMAFPYGFVLKYLPFVVRYALRGYNVNLFVSEILPIG